MCRRSPTSASTGWPTALAVARTVAIVLNAQTRSDEVPGQPEKFKLPEKRGAGDPRQPRRQDGGDQDGQPAQAARHQRHAARDPSRHRSARDLVDARHLGGRSRRCSSASDSDVMRIVGPGPPGTDFIEIVIEERPLRARMFAFSRNILLLSLLISAITATLVYLVAALPVRAAAEPADHQHGELPRGPGECLAHRRAVRPRRRDRHRGARARRDAARSRLDAAAEEPSGGARPRGVEDQPRPAQPARLGAAVLRPACAACRTRTCSASRRS